MPHPLQIESATIVTNAAAECCTLTLHPRISPGTAPAAAQAWVLDRQELRGLIGRLLDAAQALEIPAMLSDPAARN